MISTRALVIIIAAIGAAALTAAARASRSP